VLRTLEQHRVESLEPDTGDEFPAFLAELVQLDQLTVSLEAKIETERAALPASGEQGGVTTKTCLQRGR
jgi:hypothetical protein